jgi:hypothetical protein
MDDAELLDEIAAASTAPVVIVSPATLARLLVIAGYEGMAAHHAMLADRREMLEVAGPSLTELVNEARAKASGRSIPP